jgi:predicted phosphodiesterase
VTVRCNSDRYCELDIGAGCTIQIRIMVLQAVHIRNRLKIRVAIIADIHGNLTSLHAVLQALQREGIERIVCLGDVAGLGSQPREVIAELRALRCPMVMGNADEFLLNPSSLEPKLHPDASEDLLRMHEMELWCAEQLNEEDREFLTTFQPTVEITLGEDESLLCYHGSPRSCQEEIRGSAPDAELAERLGERRTLVMAGGHTHDQFFRRFAESIIINPGSVGLPYEVSVDGRAHNPPWAEYAVLTYDKNGLMVDLCRVPVDLAAIRRHLLACGMPHAEWWAADWR